MMVVAPRIVKLLINRPEVENFLQERDPTKRIGIARNLLKNELLDRSEVMIELRKSLEEMNSESDIKAIWGRSLDLLDLQVELSREAGNISANRVVDIPTLEAIRRIYGRGCHLATEICHLLRGGYADGAEARWRTLYELEVISKFICIAGDDTAERYLSYPSVEMEIFYKSAKQYFERLNRELTLDEEKEYQNAKDRLFSEEEKVKSLCKRFGPCFKKDNGWAACAIRKKKPQFSYIEALTGYSKSRVLYKEANFPIHGGPMAASFRKGLPHMGYILVGPSRYGLKDVIGRTAISLESLTRDLITQFNDETIRAIYDFQYVLTEEITEAAKDAEMTLGPFKP